MSSGISQISYWQEGNTANRSSITNINLEEGGPGAMFLSYNVLLGLSVIGGLLALDHLYLRSPLTFLAKIVVNILFFGVWWLYDASQIIFNRDVIKVFGLGIPGFGPKGIGAGVLANDVPDKKHMTFLFYGLALIFGGLFGLDSFITGDRQSGFIRLISLLSVILAPLAIGWWLFNLFKFFFKTRDVTTANWEYFGAPMPTAVALEREASFLEKIPLIGPIFKSLFVVAAPVIQPALQTALQAAGPVKNTVDAGIKLAQTTVDTVQDGIILGKEALETGATAIDKTLNIVGQTTEAATKALELAPAAAAMTQGITPASAAQALTTLSQKGGREENESSLTGYIFIGTIIAICVSGFIATYRRLKQNGKPEKDDSPPEPGVLRKSDKKESIKTA